MYRYSSATLFDRSSASLLASLRETAVRLAMM